MKKLFWISAIVYLFIAAFAYLLLYKPFIPNNNVETIVFDTIPQQNFKINNQQEIIKSNDWAGRSTHFGFMKVLERYNDSAKNKQYVGFDFYKSNHPRNDYYITEDKNFIKYYNVHARKPIVEEIPYRIIKNKKSTGAELLFEISADKSETLFKLNIVYLFLAIFIMFYVFIVLPFVVLKNIAGGKPFVQKNILYTRIIGGITVLIPVIYIVGITVIHAVLNNKYSVGRFLHIPYGEILYDKIVSIVAGAAVLLLSHAFDKGNKIEEEQNLTV